MSLFPINAIASSYSAKVAPNLLPALENSTRNMFSTKILFERSNISHIDLGLLSSDPFLADVVSSLFKAFLLLRTVHIKGLMSRFICSTAYSVVVYMLCKLLTKPLKAILDGRQSRTWKITDGPKLKYWPKITRCNICYFNWPLLFLRSFQPAAIQVLT